MIYDYEVLCYRVEWRKGDGEYWRCKEFFIEEEASLFVQRLLEKGFCCKLLYIQSACL